MKLERVVLRQSVPRVLAATLPAHLVFGFAALQLDAIVSWPGIAAGIAKLGPVFSSVLLAVAVAAWAPVVRRGLHEAEWVGRLPLPRWRRGVAAVLPGLPALGPILAVAGLFPGGGLRWLAAALWVLPPAVAPALLPAAVGAVAVGGWSPAASLLCFFAALPLVGRRLDGRAASAPRTRAVFPRVGPVGALVARDLLAVTRRLPWAAVGLLVQSVPAFGAERIVAVQGEPGYAEVGAVVILAFAAVSAAAALGAAARSLGERFDPAEWPISAPRRVLGLIGSASVLLAPVLVAVLAAAPSIAPVAALVALASGIAWVIAADRQGIDGRAAWWSVAVGAAGVGGGAGPLLALGALGAVGAVRSIRKGRSQ